MTDRLQQLLDEAKKTVQTPQEKEEQRRSFAYGNIKIENPRITREMIDRAAEALDKALQIPRLTRNEKAMESEDTDRPTRPDAKANGIPVEAPGRPARR